MASFDESLVETLQQGLCNTLNLAERTAQLGGSFYNSLGLRGAGQTSQQAAQMWSNAAGLACNRPPQDLSGEVTEPFQGGQCPGVNYSFNARSLLNGVPNSGFFPVSGVGPISVTSGQRNDGGPRIGIEDGNGVELLASGAPPGSGELSWEITGMSPAPGSPGDCGNPPAEGPTYDPADFTINPTVNYDDRDGNPQVFSPTILYKPLRVAPNGEFSVPLDITFEDGSKVFGDFNLTTGDISIGGGNSAGDGVSGPDREVPPEEPLQEGESLVGVRVVSQVDDLGTARVTELFSSGDSPNLFIPRLASVVFERESATGVGWSETIDVKTLNAVVYSEGEAVNFQVIPRDGVTVTVKKIVRPVCNSCGG